MKNRESSKPAMMRAIKKAWDFSFKWYPLTFLGTILVVAGSWLLISSYTTRNPVGFVFGLIFMIVALANVITGQITARGLAGSVFEWDSRVPMIAGMQNLPQFVFADRHGTPPFFRINFLLRGRLRVGEKAVFYLSQEQNLVFDKGRAVITFSFPLSGMLEARNTFFVRDFLGISRSAFGMEEKRELPVLPPGSGAKKLLDVVSSMGFEDSVKKRSQDLERYFMREYIPGDRLRDINWKATNRLSTIITKISPVTQEKAKSLVVILRNLKSGRTESLVSIAHLDRIKSLLLAFLRSVRAMSPEYVFHVHTARTAFTLETEEDLERFARYLPSVHFAEKEQAPDLQADPGEIFVFSTQYDSRINEVFGIFPKARMRMIITSEGRQKPVKDKTVFRLFSPFDPCLLPGLFAFRQERVPRTAVTGQGSDVVVERDFLEIRFT